MPRLEFGWTCALLSPEGGVCVRWPFKDPVVRGPTPMLHQARLASRQVLACCPPHEVTSVTVLLRRCTDYGTRRAVDRSLTDTVRGSLRRCLNESGEAQTTALLRKKRLVVSRPYPRFFEVMHLEHFSWSAVINRTSRAGELRSRHPGSEPDDRDRATG